MKKIQILAVVMTASLFMSFALGSSSSGSKETTTTTTEKTEVSTTVATTTEEAVTTVSEGDETTNSEESKDSDVVSPEVKEFCENYESFMDEYIDFMVKMSKDSTDAKLLLEYGKFMAKYAEFAAAIEKFDSKDMTPADDLYYTECLVRVEKKLLDANVTLAKQ